MGAVCCCCVAGVAAEVVLFCWLAADPVAAAGAITLDETPRLLVGDAFLVDAGVLVLVRDDGAVVVDDREEVFRFCGVDAKGDRRPNPRLLEPPMRPPPPLLLGMIDASLDAKCDCSNLLKKMSRVPLGLEQGIVCG